MYEMTAKYIKRHALCLKTKGYYLEFLDMLMYCHHVGVKLQVLVNSEVEIAQPREASEFLAGLFGQTRPDLGEAMFSLPPNPSSSASEGVDRQWTVVSTRADLRASNNYWELNHWMPLISTTDSLASRLDALHAAETAEKESVEADIEQLETQDEGIVGSLMEYMEMVSTRSAMLKRLTTRMYNSSHMFPVAVKADGNCGVWSIVDLLRVSEGVSPEHVMARSPWQEVEDEEGWQRMASIRSVLSDIWRSVLDRTADGHWSQTSLTWMKLFKVMILDAGGALLEPLLDYEEQAWSNQISYNCKSHAPLAENL